MINVREWALGGVLLAAVACSTSSSGGDGGLSCPAGSTVCGSVCADLQADPDHCGSCGTVCSHGQICDLGVCTAGVSDAARESTTDSATDSATESGTDSATEAGADSATESGTEAGTDAGADSGSESGSDADTDSSTD